MIDVSLPLSVAADHPAYAGHFPGQPILPGVVLLDEVLQALTARQGVAGAVGRITTAKFPSPVRPGEALRLDYAATAPGVYLHTFATCTHDRVYLLKDRLDLFDIQVHGAARFEAVRAAGRGALLIGAHLGSFEVVRAVGRQRLGLRVGMIMYEKNALKINAALAAINPAAVQDIIPLGQLDSMLQVRAPLAEGMVLGLLGDRTLDEAPTLPMQFLGEMAAFPMGPMRLAAALRCPVLFITGLHLGGNRYAIHFEPLADFTGVERAGRAAAIRRAVAVYAANLVRHCRSAPFNWLNFFDFWGTPMSGRRDTA